MTLAVRKETHHDVSVGLKQRARNIRAKGRNEVAADRGNRICEHGIEDYDDEDNDNESDIG